MTNPEVSVVIPTHNRAREMQRAVESLLVQTYDNFEVVIADDASADETETIARSFGDLRIRYFRQPLNVGIGRNWGFGLSQARGRFLSLLMDDDGYYPTFLADRMTALTAFPDACLAYSSYHVLQSDGTRATARLPVDTPTCVCGAEFLRHLLFGPRWIGSMLFRREALTSVWSAAEPYDLVADFAAVVRLALRPGAKAVLLPGVSFWMSSHSGQTSHTRAPEMYRMAFRTVQPLLHRAGGTARPLLRRHQAECLTAWACACINENPARALRLLVQSFWYDRRSSLRHRLYLLGKAAQFGN